MELKVQKRLAAQVLQCSPKRIRFDNKYLSEIKEGITKEGIRSLAKNKVITKVQKAGISRLKAKKRQQQRTKGRQRGYGSRKGSKNARFLQKRQWINRIRLQRRFMKGLRRKQMIKEVTYHKLYKKAKGGFFRSLRHLKIYMTENKLFEKKENKEKGVE